MNTWNLRYGWLLAAALLPGCGKEERTEAVKFCKILVQKQSEFAMVGNLEKEFLGGARSWCSSITSGGSGRADQLSQNAEVATSLARSANGVSTQLGQVRQAVYDAVLMTEFPQSVRSTLIEQLVKRQRFLQDVRTLLDEAAPVFLGFRQNRDYAGDSYPDAIGRLNLALQVYKGPGDALAEAITALKTKYRITDADLGN